MKKGINLDEEDFKLKSQTELEKITGALAAMDRDLKKQLMKEKMRQDLEIMKSKVR